VVGGGGGGTHMQASSNPRQNITHTYTHFGIIYVSDVRPKLKAALQSSKKKVCSLREIQLFDLHGGFWGLGVGIYG